MAKKDDPFELDKKLEAIAKDGTGAMAARGMEKLHAPPRRKAVTGVKTQAKWYLPLDLKKAVELAKVMGGYKSESDLVEDALRQHPKVKEQLDSLGRG